MQFSATHTHKVLLLVHSAPVLLHWPPPSKLYGGCVGSDGDSIVDEVQSAAVGISRDLKFPPDERLVRLTISGQHFQSVKTFLQP